MRWNKNGYTVTVRINLLLWAMVAVIYAPLIPAALTLISPALSLTHWQALFADPQLPQALLATLVSTTIAAVGALLIALLVIVALWLGPKWQRMCACLPWLLAIPHVAFATSALLLFADGGLLYDYFRISLRQWTDLASVWASPLQ